MKEIILEEYKKYEFKWYTKDLGRATFVICPVYKYGKLKELYMFPKQQHNIDYYYKVKINNPLKSIYIGSSDNLKNPVINLYFWCEEHKSNSFILHVPDNSKYFTINFASSLMMYFGNCYE